MSTPVRPDDPAMPGSGPSTYGDGNYPMPSSQPMLLRGVRWGIIVTVLSMLVFAGIGYAVNGTIGLVGGLIGAGIGGVLLLITVASIAFGNRFVHSPLYLQISMGIIMGSWVLKLIGFVVAAVLLRDQPWLDPKMLFISLVVTVLASIAVDVIIVMRARVPLDVQLP